MRMEGSSGEYVANIVGMLASATKDAAAANDQRPTEATGRALDAVATLLADIAENAARPTSETKVSAA